MNAMLNYLYAVLESESRLALDPGLGVMHMDAPARDSLAFDVMEPVRPLVDAYLLNWVRGETLKREWFFEQRDGNCRLMGSFAIRLSETAPTWAHAVAPFAEMVAHTLWSTIRKQVRHHRPATRLTQVNRREARTIESAQPAASPPHPQNFCRECGVEIWRGGRRCASCANTLNTVGLIEAAKKGRVAAQSEVAQTKRSETQLRHRADIDLWNSSPPTNLAQREILFNGNSTSIASNNALCSRVGAQYFDTLCGAGSFGEACSTQTALASSRTARRSSPGIEFRQFG